MKNPYSYPPPYYPPPKNRFQEQSKKFLERLVITFSAIAAVILVFVYLIKTSENETHAAGMNTPIPTIEKITASKEKKSVISATVTPAPNFLKTQISVESAIAELAAKAAALENEKAAYLAEIESDRKKAESENRQRELDQIYKLGELEYAEKIDSVNHQREIYSLEISLIKDINAANVEKAIAENAIKIKNLERREGLITGIIAFLVIGICTLAIVILALFIIGIIRNYQATKPKPPDKINLTIFNEETKQTRFRKLPVTQDQFRTWANAVIKGQNLSYKYWVEDTNYFTRTQYEDLNTIMFDNKILEYINGKKELGKVGTKPGIKSLQYYLKVESPQKSPTPVFMKPPST